MNYNNSIIDLVGKTPLVKLQKISEIEKLSNNIFAKLERNNPAGSIKDRVAKQMIEEAEAKGILKKGSTIIEPTSGNTGIGISAIAAYKGYEVIIVMPENMSIERQKLMTIYGAKLVLTSKELGMKGSITEAERLKQTIPNAVMLDQFNNEASVRAHYNTAKEIYDDLDGEIDAVVAGIGTGGTITGIAKYMKNKNPNIKIIGVEPESSPFLSKGVTGKHRIQGIGAGFKPSILDLSVIDEIITINDDEAFYYAKLLARKEGLLVGISSGASLAGAIKISKRNKYQNVVTIFPDTGERYVSTKLFEEGN